MTPQGAWALFLDALERDYPPAQRVALMWMARHATAQTKEAA